MRNKLGFYWDIKWISSTPINNLKLPPPAEKTEGNRGLDCVKIASQKKDVLTKPVMVTIQKLIFSSEANVLESQSP